MRKQRTTQNSEGSERPGLKNLKPFPKGVSGNPGGRPKGFAAFIREQTAQGEELVLGVLKIFRTSRSDQTRLHAATWLADRGLGKPTETIELKEREPVQIIFDESVKPQAEATQRYIEDIVRKAKEAAGMPAEEPETYEEEEIPADEKPTQASLRPQRKHRRPPPASGTV